MKKLLSLFLVGSVAFTSCKKNNNSNNNNNNTPSAPRLRFVFKFDSTQTRLGDSGQVVTLSSTHRAQCPNFNGMSVHHVEMAQTPFTGVGQGAVLYTTPTVSVPSVTVWNASHTQSQTYSDAIDFNMETVVGNGQEFFSLPLSQVAAGTYPYLRISVAYQNYTVRYAIQQGTAVGSYTLPSTYKTTGTIASFIGYNTYIGSYNVKNQSVTVNGDKQQGYWAFESAPFVYGGTSYTSPPTQGQAPQGATTVVNPLFASSAVPPGSCLVTAAFVSQAGASTPLVITGNETSDVVITVSMCVNNSFEWKYNPSNPNDGNIYPLNGDTVVNMGVRGMKPILP
ncbi:MAG: hypothetical protein JST67_02620 [Bacteroidetes bacterium]|nr:hypothetical protein [Bacteroidota bacterium]